MFDSYDKTISFSEKERKMNEVLVSKVKELAGMTTFGNEGISLNMWSVNPNIQWATMAVTNSLIDAIIPDVLDKTTGLYTETKFIDWGDSASFTVEPNDLFVVSKAGRNQRTVEFQRQFSGTVTDESGSPVKGIKVSAKNVYRRYDSTLIETYGVDSTLTDSKGKYAVEGEAFLGEHILKLIVEDLDGEANGGNFMNDTIDIDFEA